MSQNKNLILLRGGGDLASGIALRLYRAGLPIVISELAQPLAVRRAVSFAEAVYEGQHTVEGITARLVKQDGLTTALEAGEIPVLVDPHADILLSMHHFLIVVDARLIKLPPAPLPATVPLQVGVGPGFQAGRDCHAVIETRRSHTLGRVYWEGTTQADSGQPEGDRHRVLRAPADGIFVAHKRIGEHCEAGDIVGMIGGQHTVISQVSGVVRGMIHDELMVSKGLKIGDVDPRDDVSACYLVSDKALSIGGGVLEAILSREEIRNEMYRQTP